MQLSFCPAQQNAIQPGRASSDILLKILKNWFLQNCAFKGFQEKHEFEY
jgi:hypothetical protein